MSYYFWFLHLPYWWATPRWCSEFFHRPPKTPVGQTGAAKKDGEKAKEPEKAGEEKKSAEKEIQPEAEKSTHRANRQPRKKNLKIRPRKKKLRKSPIPEEPAPPEQWITLGSADPDRKIIPTGCWSR